jgi:hypothetical protein
MRRSEHKYLDWSTNRYIEYCSAHCMAVGNFVNHAKALVRILGERRGAAAEAWPSVEFPDLLGLGRLALAEHMLARLNSVCGS